VPAFLLPLLLGLGGDLGLKFLLKRLFPDLLKAGATEGSKRVLKTLPSIGASTLGFGGGIALGNVLSGEEEQPGFLESLPGLAAGIGGSELAIQKLLPFLLGFVPGGNIGKIAKTVGQLGLGLGGFIAGEGAADAFGLVPDPQETTPLSRPDDNASNLALLNQLKQLDPSVDNFSEFEDLLATLQLQRSGGIV